MKSKSYLKQKRNRQYEEITKEFSEAGLNLSEVKLEDFAESRKKETIKFQKVLSSKKTSKTGHQLLPKHMRRRQMSHNPYRIPRRNRLANLTVNVKSKCTKHKRKLKNLKNSLIRRATKQNWLETHLWLSKRFVMKKYLDTYTIPYKRRDKGLRACYKYWQYNSCIHDMSYYEYLVIKFKDSSDINSFFNALKEKYTLTTLPSLINEMKLYEIDVYNKRQLIGPVSFFYKDKVVIFSVVSIITNEVNEMLNEMKINDNINCEIEFTHNINTYVLFGKDCLNKMYNIFKACENDNERMSILNSYEGFKDYFEKCENGHIELIKVNTPSSQFKVNELIFTNCLKSLEYDKVRLNLPIFSDTNKYSNDVIELFTSSSKVKKGNENDYMNNSINKRMLIDSITERTTFMHRKEVDLKELNKKMSDSIKMKKMNQPIQFQAKKNSEYNKGQTYDSKAIKPKDVLSVNKETYITIIKQSIIYDDNKVEDNYLLLFKRGFSNDLLRRYVYINTKAVGLKEYERYKSQFNKLNFPKDYPGTFAYKQYILTRAKSAISKYYKKPPSKRINYIRINNPSPFYPSWYYIKNTMPSPSINDSLNKVSVVFSNKILASKEKITHFFNLVGDKQEKDSIFLLGIKFHTVERGVPRYNDLICIPNEKDIQMYLDYIKNKKVFKTNLFGEQKENVTDINIINTVTNNFLIHEQFNTSKIEKNNTLNREIVSILDYYESNMTKQLTNKTINSDFTLHLSDNPKREIIGYVTSGLYDYNSNLGKGQAFIIINKYSKLIQLKKTFGLEFIPALLRNKTSIVSYIISLDE